LGDVAVSGNATAVLNGVSAQSAIGTVVVNVSAFALPSGIGATAAAGSASLTADALTLPGGVEGTAQLGTAVAAGGSVGEAVPAGVSATSGLGSVAISADAEVAPSGVEATSAIGTAVATGGVLSPPVLTYPDDLATGVARPVTFTWDAVGGADLYHILVAEDSGFVTVVVNEETAQTSYEATGLAPGTEYWWKVRAGVTV
jgi:hypothetical protein